MIKIIENYMAYIICFLFLGIGIPVSIYLNDPPCFYAIIVLCGIVIIFDYLKSGIKKDEDLNRSSD
jgi:hypothetical protein